MKLVNISSKIINVGEVALMPDKDMPCNKAIAELPAVKAFVKAGFIRVDNSDELVAKDAEKTSAEKKATEAKKKAEAEAKAKASK